MDRFPDQNPNPIMRISRDGVVLYANASSEPIRRALGVEVGDSVGAELLADLLSCAADTSLPPIEVTHDYRTYSLLAVYLDDLAAINVYGSDVTGEKVVARFPDQNPNPVLRVDDEGRLVYANASSEPLVAALDLRIGEPLPAEVGRRLIAAADAPTAETLELAAGHRTYALRPVHIPEFGFVNVYGTDITAQKVVDKFPAGNPNPVLRVNEAGELLYANDASAAIVRAHRLEVGRPVPEELTAAVRAHLAGTSRDVIQISAGERIYELKPVMIHEFGFINLYGTDVTAVHQLADAHRENQRLLLNILPPAIAERLLRGERIIADRHEDVTLLFADIVDFTVLSSQLSATEVVGLLNEVFSMSDRLADHFGLEKIKTVGDAYMVVGGLPEEMEDHAGRVADMALALSDELRGMKTIAGQGLTCRMGMHLGPAVAGVIGSRKFIYDVWGDTVNTASRMESHGVPGRVQVTEPVYQRLVDRYVFEPRGVIEVKGKGPMATWFLLGRR